MKDAIGREISDVFIPVFSSNHNGREAMEFMGIDVFIPVFSSNHN